MKSKLKNKLLLLTSLCFILFFCFVVVNSAIESSDVYAEDSATTEEIPAPTLNMDSWYEDTYLKTPISGNYVMETDDEAYIYSDITMTNTVRMTEITAVVDRNGVIDQPVVKTPTLDPIYPTAVSVTPMYMYIRALSSGVATITVTAKTAGDDGKAVTVTKQLVIIVKSEIDDISKTEIETYNTLGNLDKGNSFGIQSNATLSYCKWISEREAVATVTNGRVIIQGAGETTITLAPMGYNDQVFKAYGDTVTIKVPLRIKLLNKPTTTADKKKLVVGNTLELTTNAAAGEAYWSSDNASVAKVDSLTGVVTAVGVGEVHITATISSDSVAPSPLKSEEITLYVVDDLAMSESEITINKNDTYELEALITNINQDVEWTYAYKNTSTNFSKVTLSVVPDTDNNTKVKLSPNGYVGTLIVTASQTINGIKKNTTCIVTVNEPVNRVVVTEKEYIMYVDDAGIYLDYIVLGDIIADSSYTGEYIEYEGQKYYVPTNKEILWATSNPEVATVSEYVNEANVGGFVTPVESGTVAISAISLDGQKISSCNVSVRKHVEKIELNYNNLTMSGSSKYLQLVATIYPVEKTTNQELSWSSSNPEVATVDNNGMVTLLKPGYTVITAISMDRNVIRSATCTLYVTIPVERISLDRTSYTLSVGDSFRLIATVRPTNAGNKTVTWDSSNKSVAIVDENGYVTALAGGNATIMARTDDGGYVATCTVKCVQEVTSLTLSADEMSVNRGSVIRIIATVAPSNASDTTVEWSSSNPTVASVNQNGEVKGIVVGDPVIITAKTKSGNIQEICVVTVTEPVTDIAVLPAKKTINKGKTLQLSAVLTPYESATNQKVIWSTSNKKVAKVDSNGKVTAVAGGTATITATTQDGSYKDTCKITVVEKVKSITLDKTDEIIQKGNSFKITATILSKTVTNNKLKWVSSNKKIAIVNSKGKVTGVGVGRVKITAKATDGSGKKAVCKVRVIQKAKSLKFNKEKATLTTGKTYSFAYTLKPTDTTIKKLTWESSDENVATVDENGKITAVAVGICTITIKTTDGSELSASCKVTVQDPIPIKTITVTKDKVTLLKGETTTVIYRYLPLVNTDTLKWTTDNAQVAKVDSNGRITGTGAGTTTITLYSELGNVQAKITVNVIEISRTSLSLEIYDRYKMEVYGATSAVSWQSSNVSVATIDSTTGEILAHGIGTTTLTATVDGKTLTCKLIVHSLRS